MAPGNDARDEQLVREAKGAPAGDLRAFETLVRRYQDRVLANCHHLSGSWDDAQDLAQEVFIKAFFGLAKFEERAPFRTWLQRIKVNHCLNHLRKSRRYEFLDMSMPRLSASSELSVSPAAERRVYGQSERNRIAATLESLPDTLRIPLIMSDMDDLSYQEIADELEIGLSAVKMRIKRAREMFRRLYRGQEAADVTATETSPPAQDARQEGAR